MFLKQVGLLNWYELCFILFLIGEQCWCLIVCALVYLFELFILDELMVGLDLVGWE